MLILDENFEKIIKSISFHSRGGIVLLSPLKESVLYLEVVCPWEKNNSGNDL